MEGNFTGYCDPEHDALGLGQEREFEPRDRADLLLSLQHTWLAAQPNSILYNPRTVWAHQASLQGFDGVAFPFVPDLWSGQDSVTFALPVAPRNFDPIFGPSTFDFWSSSALFESLFRYDSDPAPPTYLTLVQDLAATMGELVPDPAGGHRVTLGLRASNFADGRVVTASGGRAIR